ncbi:hypothetical protein D9758_016212 [Tetrapyrgos nigripes]|uniref:ATP-dependent DNA helicase n=1 Tax=Tetrapyrgos nigripes TaxID=182062 RepID=A0A8H5FNY9_9AGAR|nr:hypothetical protein D9758_016212 [Tetrapyrgos nigripes]
MIKDYDHWLLNPDNADCIARSFESLDSLGEFITSIPVKTRTKYDGVEYHIHTQDFQGQSNVLSNILCRFFVARFKVLSSLSNDDLAQVFLFYFPGTPCSSFVSEDRLSVIRKVLAHTFGSVTENLFEHGEDNCSISDAELQNLRAPIFDQADMYMLDYLEQRQHWPQEVPISTILSCVSTYHQKTIYIPAICCACCACDDFEYSGQYLAVSDFPSLTLLKWIDPFIVSHASPDTFTYADSSLNGALLSKKGVLSTDQGVKVYLCHLCLASLSKSSLPALSLANNLYRGELPFELRDLNITWAEEMVCAIYHTTVHVLRLYGSLEEDQPRVLHGNACAFELNTVSTANVLPWTPNDLNNMISVVFVGPKKLTLQELRQIKQLMVRKSVIWTLLNFLFLHNRLYHKLPPPCAAILNMYPDNDILPGLQDCIIYDHSSDAQTIFNQESSCFSEHPNATFLDPDADQNQLEAYSEHREAILEHLGVHDPRCTKIPARSMVSSALRNVNTNRDQSVPDLAIHHSYSFVSEYNNPDLISGMFPTLFPFGTGGFENRDRKPRSLSSVANAFNSLTSESLDKLAKRVEKEGYLQTMSSQDKVGFQLLKKVNAVAARIPGSQSAKVHTRNEIRSYFAYFGLPQLFFTFNPCAVHSPIFQVIYGDTSVDLNQMFPKLVSRYERARRLARDPVAGTDFFQFSFKMAFQHLLGWDFEKRRSTEAGGIFGKLRAFYGTLELTERGEFHGHFEIWLVGGMNPSDIHTKMRNDPDFERRFCNFFDCLIWHHLPNIEYYDDKNVEPRAERPPVPPSINQYSDLDIARNWDDTFQYEHKKLGEKVQRHRYQGVCFKGRPPGSACRFGYPHELQSRCEFEPDTNAIYLPIRDPDVNYHNPIILVFTCHNHNLKCILSGKAAKAAMFYITDYITKNPLSTGDILSLMSKAMASLENLHKKDPEAFPLADTKRILQKCISQLTSQQRIHAQQAARYLRGLDDTLPSHATTPLQSALLLDFVSNQYTNLLPSHQINNDPDDVDCLAPRIRVQIDDQGSIKTTNQVLNYWFRDEQLSQISFYNFTRSMTVERKRELKSHRSNIRPRFRFLPHHPLHNTHDLVLISNDFPSEPWKERVPIIIGKGVPRFGSSEHKLFSLAHFKPFGPQMPLIASSIDQEFESYQFSPFSQRVISNWEAIHECEDERDAERIYVTSSTADIAYGFQRHDSLITNLRACQWLMPPASDHHINSSSTLGSSTVLPSLSKTNLDNWTSLYKKAASDKATLQRAVSNPSSQVLTPTNCPNMSFDLNSARTYRPSEFDSVIPKTELIQPLTTASSTAMTPSQVLKYVADTNSLNEKQYQSFYIIASRFLQRYIFQDPEELNKDPLHMFLTGPGGTGKTHVVKSVQEVMKLYGMDHRIRFLAPTGRAASLIDGMTIHKGLGIQIKSKEKGKGNRKLGESEEDYTVCINVKKREQLRAEWKDVVLLFVDEVSMVDVGLFAHIDAALCFATENHDEYFGGIFLVAAGHFNQLPPVAGCPLYMPIRTQGISSQSEIERRLGRMAWKTITTVISLSEQKRTAEDPDYGAAVLRLRNRECTQDHVDLFNSSAANGPSLIECVAYDEVMEIGVKNSNHESEIRFSVKDAAEPSFYMRSELLKLNFSSQQSRILPGSVLLSVSIPGLPEKWFPILPQSSTFTVTIKDETGQARKLKCFRKQLLLQPAFTITGHFAQGQTLPVILCSFNDGPAAAYVSASQATERTGLFLLDEVTLEKLNSPKLPRDLHMEYERLEALEHNTMVEWLFIASDPVPVPVIEGEFLPSNIKATFNIDQKIVPAKRKQSNEANTTELHHVQHCKKSSITEDQLQNLTPPATISLHPNLSFTRSDLPSQLPLPGCVWDNLNWSCAYDTALTLLTYIFRDVTERFSQKWSSISTHSSMLINLLTENCVLEYSSLSTDMMNAMRETLRNYLTNYDPHHFVRSGPHMASCSSIMELFTTPFRSTEQCLLPLCCAKHNIEFLANIKIPFSTLPSLSSTGLHI